MPFMAQWQHSGLLLHRQFTFDQSATRPLVLHCFIGARSFTANSFAFPLQGEGMEIGESTAR